MGYIQDGLRPCLSHSHFINEHVCSMNKVVTSRIHLTCGKGLEIQMLIGARPECKGPGLSNRGSWRDLFHVRRSAVI